MTHGYKSPLYAEALAEFGTPLRLSRSDGWVLARAIPGSEARDAVGCYPLFCCGDANELGADLDNLAGRAVAVSMVVDPFCGASAAKLAAWFPDCCRAYKEHFVVEFEDGWRSTIDRHHRRNIRAALREVEVERCEHPSACLETWTHLYGHLIRRHAISGIARFSASSFARQLAVPGIRAFRAVWRNETVGMLLWFHQDAVAYYHLGAFAPAGYEIGAAFALFHAALEHFAADGVRWAELGAGAGWQGGTDDGLTRFKRGWANQRRTAWFCGRVLEPEAYRRLAPHHRTQATEFFPAYRRPEAA